VHWAQRREKREKGKENSEIKAGKRQRNIKGDRGKKVGTGARNANQNEEIWKVLSGPLHPNALRVLRAFPTPL